MKKNKVVSNILYENNKVHNGRFLQELENINKKINDINSKVENLQQPPPPNYDYLEKRIFEYINKIAAAPLRAVTAARGENNSEPKIESSEYIEPPPPQAAPDYAYLENKIEEYMSKLAPPAPPAPPPPSPKPIISTNTLVIDSATKSPIILTDLTEPINRFIIKNLIYGEPEAAPPAQIYKYVFYVKRKPFLPNVNYINIENIEVDKENAAMEIIPPAAPSTTNIVINLSGSEKYNNPSVNSSIIKQEFVIITGPNSFVGYQTLFEY